MQIRDTPFEVPPAAQRPPNIYRRYVWGPFCEMGKNPASVCVSRAVLLRRREAAVEMSFERAEDIHGESFENYLRAHRLNEDDAS